jgi:PAS domain S-box-containing protein
MKQWAVRYESLVKYTLTQHVWEVQDSLSFWQNQLFINLLVYCLPFSFIAAGPGLYMAIHDNYPGIAIADGLSVLILAFITFAKKPSLNTRKLLIVIIAYSLAIFLINALGYVGPGIFYLFAITIFMAVIYPVKWAYWSVAANALLLTGFAFVLRFKLFNSSLIGVYSASKWLAFSSNLIFLSIIIVIIIHRLFESLHFTVKYKDQLQERYKTIFDRSPLPMWIFDTDTLKFLEVNQAALRNYGYTREEFLQMTIEDIHPREKAGEIEELVKTNKLSGLYYSGNAEHVKKNGENIYVKIESELLELDGRLTRLVLATDITQQLESELEVFNANKKVMESEADLRAVFESSIDGFVLLDDKLRVKIFNPKANLYVKLSRRQFAFEIGKSIFDFVEDTRLAHFKGLIARVNKGEVIDYDRRHRAVTGEIYWIRYALTPVYQGKRVKGVCITGRDVTVRREYQKTLEGQNKLYKEISWMQSHLVRAPLARIMGLNLLLKSATDEAEKEEILDYMTISTNELDDIIKQITQKSTSVIEKNASILN